MSTARQYELVYIITPEASEQEIADLHTQIEQIVQRYNGTLDKTENWGRKRLAYDIGHHREGNYVVETITGSGELMKEIDRRLRVIDQVIRHLVVRVEELRVARTGEAREVHGAARVARAAGAAACEGRGDGDSQTTLKGWRPAMREERGPAGGGGDKKDGKGGGSAATWILPPPPRVQVLRRRSTTSTTRTCVCWHRFCPSAGRFSRVGSRARARCTSASCRSRSSAPVSWR